MAMASAYQLARIASAWLIFCGGQYQPASIYRESYSVIWRGWRGGIVRAWYLAISEWL